MTARGISSAYTSRIEALKNKYAVLNTRIEEAQRHPSTADYHLTELKKQRLRLEEEIERMKTVTS